MDRPGRASLTFVKAVNCYFAFLSWYLASNGRAIPKVHSTCMFSLLFLLKEGFSKGEASFEFSRLTSFTM
jgi:hypothetical protein